MVARPRGSEFVVVQSPNLDGLVLVVVFVEQGITTRKPIEKSEDHGLEQPPR